MSKWVLFTPKVYKGDITKDPTWNSRKEWLNAVFGLKLPTHKSLPKKGES